MAQPKVIWSTAAQNELEDILGFFNQRNQSKTYSKKLYSKFKKGLSKVAITPNLGLSTQIPDVKGLIEGDYILFYQIKQKLVVVLKVWDCRQNPERIKFLKR